MNVTITARHTDVPARIRDRAHSRLERISRYQPRATAADVIFQSDHGESRVEVRLHAPGHTVVSHGNAAGFRAALDQAVDRLGRQLRRRIEQRHGRKGARVGSLPAEIG